MTSFELHYAQIYFTVCEYNALDEYPSSDIMDDITVLASRGTFSLLAVRETFTSSNGYSTNFNTQSDRNKYDHPIAAYRISNCGTINLPHPTRSHGRGTT